jgi:hypothetical protein
MSNFFPLKGLDEALCGIKVAAPGFPQVGISARAQMDAFNQISADFLKSSEKYALLWRDALPDPTFQKMFEGSIGRFESLERMAVSLPKLALQDWPGTIVWERFGLIEDSLRNVAALQDINSTGLLTSIVPERIQVAGDFVWNHAKFVRELPPRLPEPEESEPETSEELGPRLDSKLSELDPRLAELRREAWKNLANGKAGARLAAHGVREVLSELLRTFAPDEDVKNTEIWTGRKDEKLAKPTRRMRFEYIVGPGAADLAAVIQFDESVTHGNKYAHIFAEEIEVVRAYLGQLEACIYLIITYGLERRSRE